MNQDSTKPPASGQPDRKMTIARARELMGEKANDLTDKQLQKMIDGIYFFCTVAFKQSRVDRRNQKASLRSESSKEESDTRP